MSKRTLLPPMLLYRSAGNRLGLPGVAVTGFPFQERPPSESSPTKSSLHHGIWWKSRGVLDLQIGHVGSPSESQATSSALKMPSQCKQNTSSPNDQLLVGDTLSSQVALPTASILENSIGVIISVFENILLMASCHSHVVRACRIMKPAGHRQTDGARACAASIWQSLWWPCAANPCQRPSGSSRLLQTILARWEPDRPAASACPRPSKSECHVPRSRAASLSPGHQCAPANLWLPRSSSRLVSGRPS